MSAGAPDTRRDRVYALEARGVVKRYGRLTALAGVDLSVRRGSVHGLVGTNGAGKTTLLRILATVLRADGGSARVGSVDVFARPRAARARLGFMPDFFGVYEDLTVEEYLDFFGAAYGLGRRQRRTRIATLLTMTHLEGKAGEQVHSLSRGMQQRLCMARALVHEPAVLLLDEPASGLDPRGRADLREVVRDLAARGTGVLISSHILSELADMCSEVTIVEQGRVVASGSIDTIAPTGGRARTLVGRVLGDAGPWVDLVGSRPGVLEVSVRRTGELEISFVGDLAAQTELVRDLVQAGVPLAALEAPRALEEAYFESTRGLVT